MSKNSLIKTWIISSWCLIAALICIFACSPLAEAKPPPAHDVHETVKIWLIYKLKTELGLDTNQSLLLFEKIEKIETVRKELHRDEREILRRIEMQFRLNETLPAEMVQQIKILEKRQDELLLLELKTNKEIRDTLAPGQRAKMMIIMHRLHLKIKSIIETLEKRSQRRDQRRNRPDMQHPPQQPFDDEQNPF
ncbi:hypothetical protein ACFL27_16485 [candidate division CSSED10-310 bacterium]|uniref:Periplasmic heavy metal sensor n=1 Tax=candidate division CSSED10-310 bacterium TaxID=2855610 RepID=A0ABV6Z025_UNCC1